MNEINLEISEKRLSDERGISELYRVCSPTGDEDEMREYLFPKINAIPDIVFARADRAGNLLVQKGHSDTFPCIVSHLDEVHARIDDKEIAYDEKMLSIFASNSANERVGAGVASKNGIWICLEALRKLPACKVVFFMGGEKIFQPVFRQVFPGKFIFSQEIERKEYQGSNSVDMKFFDDCRFVLEASRYGYRKFSTWANGEYLCSEKFLDNINETMEENHYTEDMGNRADVGALKARGLPICCINLSSGIHNVHAPNEYTVLYQLFHCRDLVLDLCRHITTVQPHTKGDELEGDVFRYV